MFRTSHTRALATVTLVAALIVAFLTTTLASTAHAARDRRTGVTTTTISTTSTTTAVPPPPVLPSGGDITIGYIGCSNTFMTVGGYLELIGADPATGEKFWPTLAYGGGTVELWAMPASRYWDEFDRALATYGEPDVIWWSLCAKYPVTTEELYAAASAVVPLIRERTDAPIAVSGINGYVDGFNDGVAWVEAATVAQMLVEDGTALAGPTLSELGPDTTINDHTHPNGAGRKLLGGDLLDFFGSPSTTGG